MTRCASPLPLAELIAYERGDADPSVTDRVEEHLFECTECASRLEALVVLAESVGALARSGKLSTSAPSATLERAQARGLRVRVYRVEPGATVQCTAAPDDDFVALRLAVTVAPDETVDVITPPPEGVDLSASPEGVMADVLVDRERGEVVYLHSGDIVRSLPRSVWSLKLRIHGPRGERWSGPYKLDHTPWSELRT